MGALLGIPQHNTGPLYAEASGQGMLTEGAHSQRFFFVCLFWGFLSIKHDALFRTKTKVSKCLTESLLRVLTTHPTYQKVVNDYLQGEEAGPQPPPAAAAANGKAVNNNGVTHGANGFLQHNKKFE